MYKYECIVSRYNEYIDFIQELLPLVNIIIIYNKGFNNKFFKEYVPTTEDLKKIKIINLDQVGRINHTVAYHIVNNWEYLTLNEDILLVSIPGSIKMNPYKGMYLSKIKKQIIKNEISGFYSPRSIIVPPDYNYITNVPHESKIFCNVNNNPFIKSEYPSLLDYKEALIDNTSITHVSLRSMFVVHSKNITRKGKEIYENILKSLSTGDNLENCQYVERLWAHIFT